MVPTHRKPSGVWSIAVMKFCGSPCAVVQVLNTSWWRSSAEGRWQPTERWIGEPRKTYASPTNTANFEMTVVNGLRLSLEGRTT